MTSYREEPGSGLRKDADIKVSGQALYSADYRHPGMLYASLKTSPHPHAKILSMDLEQALAMPGVKKIVTGEDLDIRLGLYLGDKTPMARGVVRHQGEVVAAVLADSAARAKAAMEKIQVRYEPLKPILSPEEALAEGAAILHPDMDQYVHIPAILPEPGSNVANRTKIRKGDSKAAFEAAAHTVDVKVSIPVSDHVAMEPRAAMARIQADGEVHITSATQAPFVVKNLLAIFFDIDPGKVVVHVPYVGGGFGGKAGLQLEGLAYLLSREVGGRAVLIENTREDDLLSSPGAIGMEGRVQIAADEEGRILGMELDYHFDTGAYADYAVNISRAAAIACTGPYKVDHVRCDSLCVYTNQPFATAFRGFGHIEMGFAIERAMDVLAKKIGMDSLELRYLNAIRKGDTTPVQSILNESTGDLPGCIREVQEAMGVPIDVVEERGHKVIARGMACLWKAPAMPSNTDAGAILTFNADGSCNLQTGIVEIGQGTKSSLAQIVAHELSLPTSMVHIQMEVQTRTAPSDWATAASRSLMMVGSAALEACRDAARQLKQTASEVLRVPLEDLVLNSGVVEVEDEPDLRIPYRDLALGYVFENGNAIRGQVIASGRYIARRLTGIDPETGKGRPDLEWTLGAQAVEVEVDRETGEYDVLRVASCMDVGTIINEELARGQVIGALAMGLSYSAMEGFIPNRRGMMFGSNLRDYKIMRYSQKPEYLVRFLNTPQMDGPYGVRGLGEQGIIGMPGALSNALSRAVGRELNSLPLIPQKLLEEGPDV